MDSTSVSRRFTVAVALSASILTGGCGLLSGSPGQPVTAGDLAGNAAGLDGKLVRVGGRVTQVRLFGGSRSPLRRVLDLSDGGGTVTAVSTGGPACHVGDLVTVEGRYRNRDGVVEAWWVSCS